MNLRPLISRAALLLVLIAAIPAVASAQDGVYVFEYRQDPVLAVASYYNALNAGDYTRAYAYWENVPDDATLDEFIAGFSDTERVAAYLGAPVTEDPGAGNIFAQVPVLLVAAHTDGSLHNFTGCVTVHKTNVPVGDATEPDPNWSLRDATFTEIADFDFALLETSCADALDVPSPYENVNSPIHVLAAYYDAINRGEYERAYSYWEIPPAGETLEAFSAGFADTESVELIVRADGFSDGAAGSIYVSLPVLLKTTHTDGGIAYYGGCFVTRHSNVPVGDDTEPSPEWWLLSAQLAEQPDISDGLALIDGACFSETEAVG